MASAVPGRNGIRYSSSSSLSSIATNASISNLPLQTTISPVLSVSSPTRASPALNRSSTSPPSSLSSSSPSSSFASSAATNLVGPLSLTTKGSGGSVMEAHNNASAQATSLKITTTAPLNGLNLSNSSLTMVNGASINGTSVTLNGTSTTTAPLPVIVGGANGATNIVGFAHSQLLSTSAAGGSPAIQTIPLNLNVTSSAVSNGLSGTGPTSIAITTANTGGSVTGALSLPPSQALQLTTTNGGGSNGIGNSNMTTTVVGTGTTVAAAARSLYNNASAPSTTIAPSVTSSASTMHTLAAGGKELINGTMGKNGIVRTDNSKLEIIATQSQPTNHGSAGVGAMAAALDPPGTKVITIMNGSNPFALAPLDKDSKMGVVLLPTSQALRVIQQGTNGLATIELASPNGSNRVQLHLTH